MTTSYAYESVSLDAVKQWFSDMQKEVYILGPLLPPGYATKTHNSEEGTGVDIETFLEKMLVQHGKRSVFFVNFLFLFFFVRRSNFIHKFSQVSFGSFHWPPVQEYVDELIGALIAKKAPFVRLTATFHTIIYDSGLLMKQILAYASPRATLSEQLAERVQSSGLGMISKWSPQQFILNHPVLHFNCYLSRVNT